MDNDRMLSKLLDRSPLVILLVGILLLIIGAAGGLPIGNLVVADYAWRIGLGIVGLILTAIGTLLAAGAEGFHVLPGSTKTLNNRELVPYMIQRIREAKECVYDVTWAEPLRTTVTIDDKVQEEYYRSIEDMTKALKPVKYREIMMFYGLEARISKVERLLERAGAGYELAGYADLPLGSPNRQQFLIIDNKEVILATWASKHPVIVKYFVDWYNTLWLEASKIRISGQKPDNLKLLNEAKRKLSESTATKLGKQ